MADKISDVVLKGVSDAQKEVELAVKEEMLAAVRVAATEVTDEVLAIVMEGP